MSEQRRPNNALAIIPQNDSPKVPEQPKQPQNLQGLLKFAMEATKAEDASEPSSFTPMDEERRKFLEEALKGLSVDVAKVLQDSINILKNNEKIKALSKTDDLPEDVENAFETLLDFIDDIDTANDFYKLGGFTIFPICFGCENDEMRAKAAEVLAELCQNNPYCQSKTLQYGLLDILINMVENEKSNIVLPKALYALSCATREFDPNCRKLLSQNGCSILLNVLKSEQSQAQTKAAFLILHIVKNYPDAKDELLKAGVIELLGKEISTKVNDSTEHLLNLLLVLIQDKNDKVIKTCHSVNLSEVIKNHLNHERLQNETQFIEEKEYCEQILAIIC